MVAVVVVVAVAVAVAGVAGAGGEAAWRPWVACGVTVVVGATVSVCAAVCGGVAEVNPT